MEEFIKERYELAMGRIREIPSETSVAEPYRYYFQNEAEFLSVLTVWIREWKCMPEQGKMERWKKRFYEDIKENYEESYGNPRYAMKKFGDKYGQLFSFVHVELRAAIWDYVFERMEEFVISCELFLELYVMFEQSIPAYSALKNVVYWYISDYSDVFYAKELERSIKGKEPNLCYGGQTHGVMDLDFEFEDAGKRLIKDRIKQDEKWRVKEGQSNVVNILYSFEMGKLASVLYRELEQMGYAVNVTPLNTHHAIWGGYFPSECVLECVNGQYEADHREDEALYLDRAYCERRKQLLKHFLEQRAQKQSEPYLMREIVLNGMSLDGQKTEFEEKPERISYSERQKKLCEKDRAEREKMLLTYFPKGMLRVFF